MKKLFVFAAFVIFAGFSGKVMAQTPSTTASATAAANVVTANSVTQGTSLNFGTMISPTTVATVVIDPATTLRTSTGTITLLSSGTPASVASFTASGSEGEVYTVTLPLTPITLTAGAFNMTVTAFTTSGIAKLDVTGEDVFNVGATLNLAANQPVGNYTGTYDVTISYQ